MARQVKPATIVVVLIILGVIYLAYASTQQQNSAGPNLRIGIPEAKSRRFGLIVDVRTPKEREVLGYYPNSIPISLERLKKEVPLDISSKNTWILVYSNGDSRAAVAANTLYGMGYKNVRYITETYLSLMPGSQ